MKSSIRTRSADVTLLVFAVGLALSAVLLTGCGDQSTARPPEASTSTQVDAARSESVQGEISGASARLVNDPSSTKGDSTMKTEIAMFGAGCFWGVEAAFRKIDGVVDTAVGYSGGNKPNPTYKEVCTDRTGHAEVVRVEYDPSRVSYEKLLELFWTSHDPTQVNRQGPDVGTQYRTVIYFTTPEQETEAMASKEKVEKSGRFRKPIATQIVKAGEFWRAEEYHQQYLEKRGMDACHK